VFYTLAGKPSVTLPAKSPFKDVKVTDPNYRAILWISSTHITPGFSDKTFRPTAHVTRQAAALYLVRFSV
jgi:hypothetical protein